MYILPDHRLHKNRYISGKGKQSGLIAVRPCTLWALGVSSCLLMRALQVSGLIYHIANLCLLITLAILFTETNLDALKTAASSGNIDPIPVMSDLSIGRRRSSSEWYKNQLTFRLRIKDPLITKQSEWCDNQFMNSQFLMLLRDSRVNGLGERA